MSLVSKAFSEIVTFSRSSNATRVGPTGLVEYAPHNLLTYSEQFDNAAWILYSSSVTSNTAAAPNGAITADTHIPNINNDIHHLYSSATIALDTQYNLSVYAKPAGYNYLDLGLIYNIGYYAGVQFDLTSGIIVRSGAGIGSTVSNAQITPVGNGWYRCSVAVTAGIAGMVFNATASNVQWTAGAFHNQSFTGDGTSGIYLWGAQLSVGPYALDYTPTTSAAVYGPRFDYDPVTLAARGLLVEEQRTNLLVPSEGTWWDNFYGSGSTLANVTTAPSGQITADSLIAPNSNFQCGLYSSVLIAGSSTASTSAFFKSNGKRWGYLSHGAGGGAETCAWFDLNNGVVGSKGASVTSSSIQSFGNGWYRCSIFSTATDRRMVVGVSDADGSIVITGNGSAGIYFWGSQVEQAGFTSSYIPTPTNSTVTRSADVASVNTLSPWFNASTGTVYAEFDIIGKTSTFGMASQIDDGTLNNRVLIIGQEASGGDVKTGAFINQSGSSEMNEYPVTSMTVGAVYKSALAFATNNCAITVNGVSIVDGVVTLPTGLTTTRLGSRISDGYLNGHLRRFAFYPRRLSASELTALTA